MTVQVLKLTSGETIVTDVLESNDKVLTVINPLEIRTEQSSNMERMNMFAFQWLPMMEEENIMYVNSSHIVGMSYASADIQEYYVSAIERILRPEDYYEKEREEQEEFYNRIKKLAAELQANTNSETFH